MKTSVRSILAVLLGVSFSFTVAAEQKQSLKAVVSWTGSGQVTKIGAEASEFLGKFKGIMYVETAEGRLNEAFIECTARHILDGASESRIGGNCGVAISTEDNVYATYECVGRPGACKGEFKLVEGTGQFEGTSGKSPMTVRSPLRFLAQDLQGQESIAINHGTMILNDLSYSIPGGAR